MDTNYAIHDKLYQVARKKGWSGWGGNDRLQKGDIMIDRIFSNANTPKIGKVLELGCGEGNISRLLHNMGFEVTGIDVSQTAIDWAKEKAAAVSYEIKYLQADLTIEGVLGNNQYDLIVDGNCLHCILGEDRRTFLQNILSAMKKDSVFFVSSMCSTSNKDEITLFEGKPYRYIPTEVSLLKELHENGFTIVVSKVYDGTDTKHITVHLKR